MVRRNATVSIIAAGEPCDRLITELLPALPPEEQAQCDALLASVREDDYWGQVGTLPTLQRERIYARHIALQQKEGRVVHALRKLPILGRRI